MSYVATASRSRVGPLLTVAVAAALIAGCGSVSPTSTPTASSPGASAGPRSGGTLRVVVPDKTLTHLRDEPPQLLDPQIDDTRWIAELWRCCLVRTLASYNGLSTEQGGSVLSPDLAAALPQVSSDGMTWTFHLKQGLHYAPPLQDVEITAQDFIRGITRAIQPAFADIANGGATLPAGIEGAWAYMQGRATSISGLEAPDDHTLLIRIVPPSDREFAATLAIPAVMPIPPDPSHPEAPFGIAQGADSGLGRSLVSSGPYMIEGSEKLDLSVPAADRLPPSGIGQRSIALVRNPSWVAANDALRAAYPDRIEIRLVDTIEQAVTAIKEGAADVVLPPQGEISSSLATELTADPAHARVHVDSSASWVRSVMMNLAVPPFDDLHVRKALNYAVDKAALVDLQGGPYSYAVIGHLVPDAAEDNVLLKYDPYSTPEGKGDVDRARQEMAMATRYDTNGDGRCDVSACQGIRAIVREQFSDVARSVADDLEPLGIRLDVEVIPSFTAFYGVWSDARQKLPMVIGMSCNSLYLGTAPCLAFFDRHTFWDAPFMSEEDLKDMGLKDSSNVTMVGATPDQLSGWGYAVTDVPNVQARIEECYPLEGTARVECAAQLDKYIMEQIAPWVPYGQGLYTTVTSPRVLTYGYDELMTAPSLDRLALRQ